MRAEPRSDNSQADVAQMYKEDMKHLIKISAPKIDTTYSELSKSEDYVAIDCQLTWYTSTF